MQQKLHIKIGDTVQVIAGTSRNQQGTVISIDRKTQRALVANVNVVKRHVKPNSQNPQGSIMEKESGIHISNLMVVHGGKPTRIGRRRNDEGKLVRYSKKTGEEIK